MNSEEFLKGSTAYYIVHEIILISLAKNRKGDR